MILSKAINNKRNKNFAILIKRFFYIYLQELYLQFAQKDKHYFTIGKKQLNWGSEILWNPTNFYIQKDPFQTQNRLEGIFQMNYSFYSAQEVYRHMFFR